MRQLRFVATAVALLFPSFAPCAQTLFKEPVDGLVRAFRNSALADGSLGDGSARQTAQILTAMGHCHRFYAVSDGPVVGGALRFLMTRRTARGLFADRGAAEQAADTTRWVIEAMSVLGPDQFRTDIADARRALLGHQAAVEPLPFAARVAELRRAASGAQAEDAVAALKERGEAVAASVEHGPLRAADGGIDAARSVEALVQLVALQAAARKPEPAAAAAEPTWSDAQQRGFEFLLANQKDGAFLIQTPQGAFADAGFTSLCLAAVQTKPAAARSDSEAKAIDAGLTWLAGQQREDGSFSDRNVNYVTCAAVMALAMAGERFRAELDKGRELVLRLQNVESRGYSQGDRDYGSIGYGGDERGDLSNLQFALDALVRSGLEPGKSDAFAKALVFLQRTQNLRQVNDFEAKVRDEDDGSWRTVVSGDDGGSAYYPGNSPAGYDEAAEGKFAPRSYGSMTYALLKAYTLCGLPADDPRIQAVTRWLSHHWTLEQNPGASPQLPEKARYQGLFYYYMVMAQALDTAGIDRLTVVSDDGTREVDWRAELRTCLEAAQQEDGSWVNAKNGRWWESMPMTCTCYAMLALGRCR